jgi:fused signal recognition particle receptor
MVFGFSNKKQRTDAEHPPEDGDQQQPGTGLLSSLRDKLGRTRSSIAGGLAALLSGRGRIDDELLEELETLLITADVGIDASMRIINDIRSQVKRKTLSDAEALQGVLKAELLQILQQADSKERQPSHGKPRVILMVGINGAGKTTTIGKLTKRFQKNGQRVMLAAGDTFRAAAVEQLQAWGERNDVAVIAQHTGADSASVIFDALEAATARGVDVLIADTAGRLHTKTNLMDELVKIVRVMKKIDPDAPHEVMLIVDGGTGQNALQQAIHFNRAVNLSSITITKLDGTAKGGILFAIADKLQIPIRYIGVGEGIDDLRPFDAVQFVDALFET